MTSRSGGWLAWCCVAVIAAVASFGCGDDAPRSSANTITAFSFSIGNNPTLTADATASVSGSSITVTVPFGTNVTSLKASFTATSTDITVDGTPQVSGATANNFTQPVTYRVIADDTTFQDYLVTVTVTPSATKELTTFAFLAADNPALAADVTATIVGDAIDATVPFGTDVTALKATFTSTGASIAVGTTAQVSGTTANDFTAPVDYHVVAADASARDYTVTVAIAASSAKTLTAFSFTHAANSGLPSDITATITGTAIAATVPNGTDVTALKATFTATGASVKVGTTVQVSGTTANNFTAAVTYRVTAADATFTDYTVTVTIAPSSAKVITLYQFLSADNGGLSADVTATITGTAITATLPTGSVVTALVATFTQTGATIKIGATAQVSGTTPNNFTNPVTYRVTAADATFADYTVTVTVLP